MRAWGEMATSLFAKPIRRPAGHRGMEAKRDTLRSAPHRAPSAARLNLRDALALTEPQAELLVRQARAEVMSAQDNLRVARETLQLVRTRIVLRARLEVVK